MGMFLVLMLGCLLAFGIVILLIWRWIERDTCDYDMRFVWDRLPVTPEQMEFAPRSRWR